VDRYEWDPPMDTVTNIDDDKIMGMNKDSPVKKTDYTAKYQVIGVSIAVFVGLVVISKLLK